MCRNNERAKEAAGDFIDRIASGLLAGFELFRWPDAWNNNKVAAAWTTRPHWPTYHSIDLYAIHYAYAFIDRLLLHDFKQI